MQMEVLNLLDMQLPIEQTLTDYFTEIGISNLIIKLDSNEKISVNYPEDYNSTMGIRK